MKRGILGVMGAVLAMGALVAPIPVAVGGEAGLVGTVYADDGDCTGENEVKTSILGTDGCAKVGKKGQGIFNILSLVLTILTYGVGIAATLGLIISGYQYLTARDDVGITKKAKTRILQIVIGLVAYAVMWAILQFLLPGGVFGDGS